MADHDDAIIIGSGAGLKSAFFADDGTMHSRPGL